MLEGLALLASNASVYTLAEIYVISPFGKIPNPSSSANDESINLAIIKEWSCKIKMIGGVQL